MSNEKALRADCRLLAEAVFYAAKAGIVYLPSIEAAMRRHLAPASPKKKARKP